MTTPALSPEDIAAGWREEEHDQHCESRMFGRCDCSKYIVIDTTRKFAADLKAILSPKGSAK